MSETPPQTADGPVPAKSPEIPVAPIAAPAPVAAPESLIPVIPANLSLDKLRSLALSIGAAAASLTQKLDGVAHSAVDELDAVNKAVKDFNDHLNQVGKTSSYVPPSSPVTQSPSA